MAEQKHDLHIFCSKYMYNKTVNISQDFFVISNNQGLSKVYPPQHYTSITDFTIHKLSSLLYTSQVYLFKYGSKRFCPLQLKGVNKQ